MKVLWFTNISFYKGKDLDSYGGFWISSLLSQVSKTDNIQIGVCYQTTEKNASEFIQDGITYYPISSHKGFLHKTINKIFHVTKEANSFNDYLLAIKKFQPDLIHIFGTEKEYAKVIPHVKCKTLIHIQGILTPYVDYWHACNYTNRDVFFASSPLKLLIGSGIYHAYFRMKKNALREREMLSKVNYVSGRTAWDKYVTMFLAPESTYFHIDEMLRDNFYKFTWSYKKSDSINILSIISDDIYKGYDLILYVSGLLHQRGIRFSWKIIGLNKTSESIKITEKMTGLKHPDNIQFLGRLDAGKITEIMNNSHLYVHPSRIENSPNSVCEAMLIGMPVIASNTGGVPTLIDDKINGLLFPNMDPYSLAGTIVEYGKQPDLLTKIGNNARKTAIERHDKQKIVESLLKTYKVLTT